MESNRNSSFGFEIRMFRNGDLKSPGSVRSDCKFARTLLWSLFFLFFVACAPKAKTDVKEANHGENLMRYARNIMVYEKDYGYRAEVICPWDTTLSLGSFAFVKDTTKAVDSDVKGVLNVPVNYL